MPQPGIVTSGLVAEYHAARADGGNFPGANNLASTQLFDTSGNANHGTLTSFGFTTASGYAGSGTLADPYRLVFDGAGDYVPIGNITPGTSDWSIDAWVKVFNVASNYGAVLNIGNVNDVNCLSLLISNASGFTVRTAYRSASQSTLSVWAPINTNLQHLCGTWDRDGMMRLYAGGASVGVPVSIAAGSADDMPSLAATLGSYPGYWESQMELVCARLYNRALSLAEVQQNYAAGYLWAPFWSPGRPGIAAARTTIKIGGYDIPVVR